MLALWGRKPCFRPWGCEAWLPTGKAGAWLPHSKEQRHPSSTAPEKIPDSIGLVQQCCVTPNGGPHHYTQVAKILLNQLLIDNRIGGTLAYRWCNKSST